jgi:hypothetical protein
MTEIFSSGWLDNMFEQVSINIHHLIDSLTYIYESHGI